MIKFFEKETVLQFTVTPPFYLPFYNRWNMNAYYKYEAFDIDPFNVRASSTSGSPVVIAGGSFFGFMNESGGRFVYDGHSTLTIICNAGQSLYYNEDCNPYNEWQKYNETVLKTFPKQHREEFWNKIEYCTWVEQCKDATLKGTSNRQACLDEKLVYNYMERVKKLGLPKGKLTIDDGWDLEYNSCGRRIYGNWKINRNKFPNMEKLVKDMTNEGFIPGLWFSPFTFTADCELAKEHPELIGGIYSEDSESGLKWMFIRPNPILKEYYHKIFSYYISMGFRKFKLDISYGTKSEMIELLSIMYDVIKSIDKSVEVEAHMPDIFATRHCDTVRLNDVTFDEEGKWRCVTWEHYRVCKFSAGHKILNLDHLGTNTYTPTAEQFLEHSKLILSFDGGYPCISLLPDYFEKDVSDEFVKAVCEWHEKRKESKK